MPVDHNTPTRYCGFSFHIVKTELPPLDLFNLSRLGPKDPVAKINKASSKELSPLVYTTHIVLKDQGSISSVPKVPKELGIF